MQNFKSFGALGAELQAPPCPRTQTLLTVADCYQKTHLGWSRTPQTDPSESSDIDSAV